LLKVRFMIRWSRLTSYAVGVFIPVLLACSREVHDHDNFREDVFQCEEAVSRLTECCPHFDHRSVTCNYAYDFVPGSCDQPDQSSHVDPELSPAQSDCIIHASCADLVANETCRTLTCGGAR
jgi:hypothetical protein